MNKKIIAISNHAHMLGGGEHSFLGLLSHLPDTLNVVAVMPCKGELESKLKKKGIETQTIPLPPIKPWYLFDILAALTGYFKLCREYRPTLIYANGSRAAFYGGIVGRILNLPVIWHCRIADSDPYLDLILTRLSSIIIANSHATGKRFKKLSQPKVRVVHNGVDLESLRANSTPKPDLIGDTWKVILVVARVSRWKRHDLALMAFEQVAAKEPDAHLVCVGARDTLEPDWWKYLTNKSMQSDFSNRIHWVGQVEDVRPWYRAASILLLCSENEPFGRVLVEAMACGLPVIAHNSGGVPEIVRHGRDGFLVSPGDVSELVKAIERILYDQTMKVQLSTSAIERAGVFSLKTHIDKVMGIMDDVIKK